MSRWPAWLRSILLLGLGCACASGKIINIGSTSTCTNIESANPGDEVVIAPGTYKFRVYLTKQATPTNPIVIHALDPSNPPVWDFGTNLVDNAPGSYTAGDRARGGWQFSGAQNYQISGIVFRHCRNAAKDCAGIRYYYGTTNLYIRNCVFASNDCGLTGGTQDSQATVEFCEFNANGNTNAPSSAPTHNIYVYGGYLAVRYCYIHDSVQGQNFHIRCRNATLEYNWIARAENYDGDLMTDDDFSGNGPYTQLLTLRGNVIVQNSSPGNNSQVIAIYNDEEQTNLTMTVRAIYNTFVGTQTKSAFVHVSNADGTRMNAEISDNIIYDALTPALIEDTNAASVTGVNNWLMPAATPGTLAGSVQTAAPGFRNPAASDFTLAPGSACIGAANTSVYGLPGKEYYLNETTTCEWRIRAAARDIGAFEDTTASTPVGPYDPPPQPALNFTPSSPAATMSWPLFAQDFELEQSPATNLNGWTPASLAYTTNASNVVVSFPIHAGGGFFRLRN